MDSIWLLPLTLLAIVLAWPAWRTPVARWSGERKAPQALAAQPDRISLVRISGPSWKNPYPRDAADRQLAAAGFVESGAYVVREVAGLTLGLYAHPAERAYAVIYDHARSGSWVEFVTRYEDGTLANFTTLEPMDVDVPEGSVHVSAPELSVGELWKRMLAERPQRPMHECSRSAAARDFERGYAESVEHHKRTAPSATETPRDDVEQVA